MDGVARDREADSLLLAELLETVEGAAYVVDGEGEMVRWNDQLERTTGYTSEELAALEPAAFLGSAEGADAPDPGAADTDRAKVLDVLTSGGEAIAHEFRGKAVDDPETGETFRIGIARETSERGERDRKLEQQRALLEGMLNTIPDVVFAFDETGKPIEEEFLLEEFAGYSREELRELHPLELIAEEARPEMDEAIADVMTEGGVHTREAPLVTKSGERIPYEFRATQFRLDDEVVGLVGTGRDVSERVRRERELQRQRDELATLNRINELILDITRELLETPSRRDLERTVCERLASSELYRFAWIGEREVDGDRIVPRVSAGDDEGYVDAVTVRTDDGEAGQGPGGRVWRTGDVQVANVDDGSFARWREAAAERDVESVAAVPIRHGEAVYGVLGVYATRADAFSEREQAGFRILGETVGFVINAIKRRKLLFAEAVTELELSITSEDAILADLSASLDCGVALDGYVEVGDRWLLYLAIDGAPPAAVVDELSGDGDAGEARVIADDADGRRVELEVSDGPLFDATAAVGATIVDATASRGELDAVVQIPGDVDVRETVELLGEELPAVALRSKRERDREPAEPGSPGGLLDELTERQREALTVAYRAGYFEWPRESTAEDVARTLDITTSTLHAHLRKAERTVLESLLEGRVDRR